MTTNSQPVGSFERSPLQVGAVSLLRRGLALTLAYLMIPVGIGDVYAQSFGQQAPPPPPDQQYGQPYNQQYGQQYNQQYGQQYNQQYGQPYGQQGYYAPLSPEQLDQLVAPVALYPDALLAQVLAASTYPTQVVDADRWMQSYQNYPPQQVADMANGMPWDPSVKSLTAFPSVLDNLARNLEWTTQLGNAYYNQPQNVMEAVQAMRQQAYDSGYLRSTPQMQVDYSPGYIEIMPANPNVVYVPYYNPWNVYGPVIHPWYQYYAPRPATSVFYGGLAIGFGVGVAVIAFSHWGWGWGHWRPDWRRHEIYHDHGRYISRSRSVFNRGHFGDFDRHYARADFRRNHNGHALGFGRRQQFRGRPNANFHAAPQFRQIPNRGQQNFHQRQAFQNRQNFHPRQGQQNRNFNRRPQSINRPTQRFGAVPQQNFNRQSYNRGQQNVHHAPPNFNRPTQRFQGQPRRSFNRPTQRFQGHPQQNFNRQRSFQNRSRQRFQRPQPQQNRNQRNFNRSARPNNRPQNHGHPNNHGNGHGHGHGRF